MAMDLLTMVKETYYLYAVYLYVQWRYEFIASFQ